MSETLFKSRAGSPEEWNEAFARVEDYLRAHRVHNRAHQAKLVAGILERARIACEAAPATPPVTHAANEARRLIDSWLHRQIGAESVDESGAGHLGRVAFLLVDGPNRHGDVFAEGDLPEEVRVGMRVRIEQSGPNMEVSSMVRRDMDLGLFPEVAEFAWDFINKWPLIRTALVLALFALFVFVVLAAMKS